MKRQSLLLAALFGASIRADVNLRDVRSASGDLAALEALQQRIDAGELAALPTRGLLGRELAAARAKAPAAPAAPAGMTAAERARLEGGLDQAQRDLAAVTAARDANAAEITRLAGELAAATAAGAPAAAVAAVQAQLTAAQTAQATAEVELRTAQDDLATARTALATQSATAQAEIDRLTAEVAALRAAAPAGVAALQAEIAKLKAAIKTAVKKVKQQVAAKDVLTAEKVLNAIKQWEAQFAPRWLTSTPAKRVPVLDQVKTVKNNASLPVPKLPTAQSWATLSQKVAALIKATAIVKKAPAAPKLSAAAFVQAVQAGLKADAGYLALPAPIAAKKGVKAVRATARNAKEKLASDVAALWSKAGKATDAAAVTSIVSAVMAAASGEKAADVYARIGAPAAATGGAQFASPIATLDVSTAAAVSTAWNKKAGPLFTEGVRLEALTGADIASNQDAFAIYKQKIDGAMSVASGMLKNAIKAEYNKVAPTFGQPTI